MAVMLKCGAIFLHVPKTGGSWVTDVLSDQQLVRKQICHIHADYVRVRYYTEGTDVVTRGLYQWAKSLLPRSVKAIGPAQKMKQAAVSARQSAPFCFCFVRHPLDWYESYWRYMVQRSGTNWAAQRDFQSWHPCHALNHTGDTDFNQFIRNVIDVRPGFVTELYGSYAQPEISFVGRQETLADDLVSVLQQLNVTFDEERLRNYQQINVSSRADEPVVWEPHTRHQLERTEYAALLRFGYLPQASQTDDRHPIS